MSDRDTHFQGFAELLYPDLAKLFVALYSSRVMGDEEQAKQAEVFIKEFLTQRVYDLEVQACLTINNEQMKSGGIRLHPNAMLRVIPDMTACPKETE